MIDIYCERIGPGLWAEPFNALTNLAFFAAALGSWRLIQHSPHRSYGMGVLVALVASIGIGSALFHTFATKWAQFLDVLPILLFQVCFIGLYSRRIISLNQWIVGVFLCAFLAATLWGRQFPGVLNGSLPYAPGFGQATTIGADWPRCLSRRLSQARTIRYGCCFGRLSDRSFLQEYRRGRVRVFPSRHPLPLAPLEWRGHLPINERIGAQLG